MIGPELSISTTIVEMLVGRDAFEEPNAVGDIAELLLDVDEREAGVFPEAFRRSLTFLESDIPRWRAAGDAAVQLDLYECIDTILGGLERFHDPHQAANVASLLSNPAIDEAHRRNTAERLLQFQPLPDLSRLMHVHLGLTDPDSPLEDVLDIQMWPGRHDRRSLGRVAPIVYVSDSGAPQDQFWQVVGSLAAAGARVRRLGDQVGDLPRPAWASTAYPIVAWSGTGVAQWRRLTATSSVSRVMVPASFDSRLTLPRLVEQVRRALPAGTEFLNPPNKFSNQADVFSVATLHEGAFDALEMMYLGAAGRSTLQTLTRNGLTSIEADKARWHFDKLLTLRLLQGFKAKGARFRGTPVALLERLRDIAEASHKTQVAIDANGRILFDDGEGFITAEGNQGAIPAVLEIDEALQSFELGGGRIPALFRPGVRTDVDPRILGGAPSVRDRRISARAMAEIVAERGVDVLRSAYPELGAVEVADGVKVGQALLSRRK